MRHAGGTGKRLRASENHHRATWRSHLLVSIALIGAIAVALYEGARASRQAREIQRLSEQVRQYQHERDDALNRLAVTSARRAPRLPAPPMAPSTQPEASAPENLRSTNLYARLKDPPKLSAEQVEAYLKAYGRKASSLLAAYRTSGDKALLREAMEKFPADPQVAFEAVFDGELSPEQRRQWLNAFEQNAPDNTLANYLSARDYLKAGQTDQAIQQLTAAAGKRFDDYTLSRRQDDEEAYLAAGYPIAEAKMIASGQVLLPQLAELKQLGLQMVELSSSYRKAGDDASAQAVLQMALNLGQSYSAADSAISHLVGMAIQRNALNAMDPKSLYDTSGRTVQDQLNVIMQEKNALSSLFRDNESLFEGMSDQDWISYIDRDKSFGEEAARRWALSKYGQK